MMIRRVTMKRLTKGVALYLNPDEAAILLSGRLHMVNYSNDLDTPKVVRLYHPGDLMGL